MKNIKKLIVFTFIIFVTASLSAKKLPNKDQVFFTNEYGADVAMILTWGGKNLMSFEVEEDHILKAHHKESMFKAPYSGYSLLNIDVTPASNIQGKELVDLAVTGTGLLTELSVAKTEKEKQYARDLTDAASVAAEIGYAVSKSLNKDELKVRNDTFFVIERSQEKSKVSGQKKIRIKEYATREHYEKEIVRVESKLPAGTVQVVNSAEKGLTKENLALEQQKIALQLEQLALEEKKLAFQEKQLAFKKLTNLEASNNVIAA